MKKKKKAWKIVLIAAGVFAVIEIVALGWFGIGSLSFIYDTKMNALPGNRHERQYSSHQSGLPGMVGPELEKQLIDYLETHE